MASLRFKELPQPIVTHDGFKFRQKGRGSSSQTPTFLLKKCSAFSVLWSFCGDVTVPVLGNACDMFAANLADWFHVPWKQLW
jgi:hypothetical protein